VALECAVFQSLSRRKNFQVGVSPEGNITGYEHKIPEAKAGAQPTRDAAQKTAQDFLIAKLGKPATDWDFLTEEANSERKPNRLDWRSPGKSMDSG